MPGIGLGVGVGLDPKKVGENFIDVLEFLFDSFGATYGWDTDSLNISGTTTTAIERGGSGLDLVNPTATNQPDYTLSDADLNNKSSLEFISTDPNYLLKNTANFGTGVTSGMIWVVYRTPATMGLNEFIFSASDSSTNNAKFQVYKDNTNVFRLLVNDGTNNNGLEIPTALLADTVYIFAFQSNGTLNNGWINKLNSFNSWLGANSGNWFAYANTSLTLDNISIGSRINTSSQYSNGKLGLIWQTPVLSTADRNSLFDALTSYYK